MSNELEKSLKKSSLELYKVRLELQNAIEKNEPLSVENLTKLNKKITQIDKDFLKNSGINFPDKIKKDFIDLIG